MEISERLVVFAGENVASIAAIINYLQVNADPSTFSVVDGPILPPAVDAEPAPESTPEPTPEPTPDPTPDPTPAPPPAPVTATLTLAGDVAAVAGVEGSAERATFEQDFKTDVASALSVQAAQITITGIVAGSVAVTFDVEPCALCGGGAVTPTAITAAFSAVLTLPTVGISTTGPVSGVAAVVPQVTAAPPTSEPVASDDAPRKDAALAVVFGAIILAGLVIWCAVWFICCRESEEGGPARPQTDILRTELPADVPETQHDVLLRASIKGVRRLFLELDTSKNGKLDKSEVRVLGTQLGKDWSDADLAKIFKHVDTDKSSELDIDEFLKWYLPQVEEQAILADLEMYGMDLGVARPAAKPGRPESQLVPPEMAIHDDTWTSAMKTQPTARP